MPPPLLRRPAPAPVSALPLLFLLFLPLGVGAGGGGKGLFDVETELMDHPFIVFLMFLLVIVISVLHEHLFEWLDKVARAPSAKKLKKHMEIEIMNLGLIGLYLTFISTIGITSNFWSVHLFHYTHFILFIMMVLFIGVTAILLLTMKIIWQTWVRYEEFTHMVKNDEHMPTHQKDVTLALYYSRNANAKRMNSCHQFYLRSVPKSVAGVEFTRYLRKAQRRWLLHLLHLNQYSWFSLALVNLVVAIFLSQHDTAAMLDSAGSLSAGSGSGSAAAASVGSAGSVSGCGSAGAALSLEMPGLDWVIFIGIVGYGTLLMLLGIMAKVTGAFRQYCEEIDTEDVAATDVCFSWELPQPEQHRLFWRGDPKFTIQLLQMVVLIQVFYLAVVICNILPRLDTLPLGTPLAIVAIVPSVVIFGFLMPIMMPPFTCLASLGDFLNTDMLAQMKRDIEMKDGAAGGTGLYAGSPRGSPTQPHLEGGSGLPPSGAFEFICGRAKGLPRMDMTGPGADPYVRIFHDGEEIFKTRVEHGLSVVWAETVKVEPPPGGFRGRVVLILEVYDWDRRGGHDFIGKCSVVIDDDVAVKAEEMIFSLKPEDEGGWDDDGGLGTIYVAARYPQRRRHDHSGLSAGSPSGLARGGVSATNLSFNKTSSGLSGAAAGRRGNSQSPLRAVGRTASRSAPPPRRARGGGHPAASARLQ